MLHVSMQVTVKGEPKIYLRAGSDHKELLVTTELADQLSVFIGELCPEFGHAAANVSHAMLDEYRAKLSEELDHNVDKLGLVRQRLKDVA